MGLPASPVPAALADEEPGKQNGLCWPSRTPGVLSALGSARSPLAFHFQQLISALQ